jgi:hypothetical protein
MILEQEMLNVRTAREEEIERDKNRLEIQVTKLRLENEKLIGIINDKN